MTDPIPVSTIANLIQLSIAPVFLLAGVGAILNVMATRLSRVVDRVRRLEAEFAGTSEVLQKLARAELSRLGKRMKLINWAITAVTAGALTVCLVVAVLFVGGLADSSVGNLIAALYVLTMALLVGGLVLFLLEIRLASRNLRVRYELLDIDLDGGAPRDI
ncbi:DUF2721 domain-containing protein [Sphingosinicella sp. YJ22]|uniref:DUF2721 domain-containing protein n=1 Tax=Sphingosinicella sp. YJ22 TaxID=1104780 RepID=UPI00140CAA78|nr:DUF2721 domain-containing protein [Sphingosinicella sp. YJ22]